MWGFGRAIALRGFNAAQPFGADMDSDQLWSVPECSGGGDVHSAIVLPNGTTLPATREAGLVQIANALIDTVNRSKLP